MVDTGATLSVIPTTVLSRLNVEPEGSQNFRGFGGVVTREIGGLRMTYDGATALITVVFGGQDDPPIMGVTALESLGYQVDPVEGKLVKSEMLLLQAG
jgi:predicted aspartyl protease